MEISAFFTYLFLFFALYVEVFLLIGFLSKGGIKVINESRTPEPVAPADLPRVAVFVPSYNEEKTVAQTITSLLSLDYPHDKLEIIVIDDGSKDRTYEMALPFTSDSRVKVLQKPNGGKHSAMNLALAHTDAEIVGCLDADSFAAKDALLLSVRAFSDPLVAATTPAIHVHEPKNMLQVIQKAEYSLSIFIRRAFASSDAILVTPGPLSLFRRSAVVKAGGWKHGWGTEDLEMTLQLREQGVKIVNDPAVTVYTTTPRTLPALYKQRVRWTYGFLMNMIDFKHMIGNPKYGALGMVVLPGAIISVFGVCFLTAMSVASFVGRAFKSYERISVTGFHPHLSIGSFDLFYFNTSTVMILAYVLGGITITLMTVGKRLGGQRPFSWDIPLYMITYGFIAPLWLIGAVGHALFRSQAKWR